MTGHGHPHDGPNCGLPTRYEIYQLGIWCRCERTSLDEHLRHNDRTAA